MNVIGTDYGNVKVETRIGYSNITRQPIYDDENYPFYRMPDYQNLYYQTNEGSSRWYLKH